MPAPQALGQLPERELDGGRRAAVQVDRPLEVALLAAGLDLEADGALRAGQRRGVEHGRRDRRGIAGPRGLGRDRDARHGDVPGERAAQVAEPDLDVSREDHGLAAVEPRTLEVGQDVQLAGLLPRTEEQVACPGHRGGVVGARVARLERGSGGGRSAGPSAGRTVSNSPTSSWVPDPARSRTDRASDSARSIGRARPAQAHAGRAVEQDDDQALARRRLGRDQVRPGEQQREQGDARHPDRQEQQAPDLPPPSVMPEHDLEELEGPQVDHARPVAEHQVDDDRDGQGGQGAEHPVLNEVHGASKGS